MRPFQVAFDARSPVSLAQFWAAALRDRGYVAEPPPPGFDSWDAWCEAQGIPESERDAAAAVVDPSGQQPRLWFRRVPESKTVKNRLHLDLQSGAGAGLTPEERAERMHAEVQRLVVLGATMAEERAEFGSRWTVMLDPEGNEFCV